MMGLVEILKFVDISYPQNVVDSCFGVFKAFPETSVTNSLELKESNKDTQNLPD